MNYQIYAGTSGPYNFNGLVRHYFLRRGANQADIQVNLLNRHERSTQSHDIAKRLRPGLVAIGNKYGARLKVAEVPPGPPVLETLVAEVYGPDYQQQMELAKQIKQGVSDDARRGGCGLVRGRSAGQVQRRRRSGQGRAEWRVGSGGDADGADGIERRDGGTAARSEVARGRADSRATRPAGALGDRVADLDAVADRERRAGVDCGSDGRQERNHRREPLRQEPAAGGVCAGRCGGRG